MSRPIFHLAFPVRDIPETVEYYREGLGFLVGLVEEGRCIIECAGHQIVAHRSPNEIPQKVAMYPRHFGLIFDEKGAFDALLARARARGLKFFQEPFARFEGTAREHWTFFLQDPSNNLLEFKWYQNAGLIFRSS